MKKKKLILGAVAMLFVIASTVTVCFNYHYIYILGEMLGIRCDGCDILEVTLDDVRTYTPDELASDGRVTLDQSAMLVNESHTIPDGFDAALTEYKDSGVYMNACVTDAYERLSLAVYEETGEKLYVSSSYRTADEQRELYDADPSTANEVGASEHQTGLALDVYVKYYAGFGFIKTEAGRFVNSECWRYGFIIRYPVFGKSETGMQYEPWHLRYVGEVHAKLIYQNRLTYEEYIDSLEVGKWYEAEGYLISRQMSDGEIAFPAEFSSAIVSEDNTGNVLVTVLK